MNTENPYQFSASDIDPQLKNDLDSQEMADHLTRLGAYILDGLFFGIPAGILLVAFGFSMSTGSEQNILTALLAAGLWMLIGIVIQSSQVATHSATIGKKLLGIKMVRMDGSAVSWPRWLFLRQGVVGLIAQIPIAGGIFALVDILMIFGAERRCIHDLIADTKVVKA